MSLKSFCCYWSAGFYDLCKLYIPKKVGVSSDANCVEWSSTRLVEFVPLNARHTQYKLVTLTVCAVIQNHPDKLIINRKFTWLVVLNVVNCRRVKHEGFLLLLLQTLAVVLVCWNVFEVWLFCLPFENFLLAHFKLWTLLLAYCWTYG